MDYKKRVGSVEISAPNVSNPSALCHDLFVSAIATTSVLFCMSIYLVWLIIKVVCRVGVCMRC